ncbi:MAG: phosphoadenosine phosphosulfate reductase family protein [Candidatus Hodarchaeota archaeon]
MFGQMMINEKGIINELEYKIDKAIIRLRTFEPDDGYWLAFSGGKDSLVIYDLAKKAGVKFEANYNITTVDPPELIYFIKEKYTDVKFNKPPENMTMWKLIIKKRMPPTRIVRYCCKYFKEAGGDGRFVITGVRAAESNKRKKNRAAIELNSMRKYVNKLNDNDEARKMIETCTMRSKHIINPIIDWSDENIWEYIRLNNLEYCKLYDEGFKRLGCVGCPMAGKRVIKEFNRWIKIKEQYIRTFQKMVDKRKKDGLKTQWNTGEEVYSWWIKENEKQKIQNENQIILEDLI